jgi:hypothetical protein
METTFDEQISKFSGFTDINAAITAPFPFDTKMEMRSLTLIAGMNNTGKSFINKLIWASATFFNTKLVEHTTGIKEETKTDEELLQFILDNTFTGNDITGAIELNARDEILKVAHYNIRFEMKDGKVTWVKFAWPKDAQPMGAITYLSKEARDFSNIERYLKTKKMMGVTELATWDDIEKLCDMWKLYDVFAIEMLLAKFEDANKYLTMLRQMAGANSDELLGGMDLKTIKYDKEAMTIEYENDKGEIKPLSTMGLGSQSIVSMLMSSIS